MKKWFTKNKICWKLMKICAVQVMMAAFVCSLAVAHDNYGQLLERKVTLDIEQVSLQNALAQIEKISSVNIFYSIDQRQLASMVSLHVSGRSLHDVLDELLTPYQIKYKVREKLNAIVLKNSFDAEVDELETNLPPSEKKALASVTGTIIDNGSGLPLPGVNVLVKGTTIGTSSNEAGVYSIQAETSSTLVFSSVGYISHEEKVGEKSVIDIRLEADIASLKEVVVNAGYWDVSKREQTGNIAKISSTEIQKQPVPNVLSALEGRMPGVYISESSGIPGAGINIQIRGQNSLRNTPTNNGNLPFYVVDGVPFTSTSLNSASLNLANGNPLISINPADIESIEILKDADATAIYGSRGANGVVLITTKKGKSGKTKFDFTLSQGVGKVASKLDLLTTDPYIQMRMEAFANDMLTPGSTDYDINGVWDKNRDTDWQKELIGGTANQTNMQGSVSGGDSNTQFLVGGSFFAQSTVFAGNTGMTRGSGRIEINNTSEDKKFNINFSGSYTLNRNNLSTDFTFNALTLAPNAPALRDENGGLNWQNNTWTNPLSFLENKYENKTWNLNTSTTIRYTILPGLNLKASIGYNALQSDEVSTNPISRLNPAQQITGRGSAVFADGSSRTWITEPQAEYKRKVSRGMLTALVGTTFQETITARQTIQGTGYTSDALIKNILSAAAISIRANEYSQYRYSALFARANYLFNEKYILNLTARRDVSSRFGSGNRAANFGAVGAAWIYSNEGFVKNALPFLSFGKLRTSYGSSGSDAIGNYQYLSTYIATTNPYNSVSGLAVSRMQNPDYSWETNTKFEAAMDLGFFSDRLLTTVSFYRNVSGNQLVGLPLPVLTGQSSVQYNLPAQVENRGWEVELNAVNINTGNFKWTTGMNVTFPKNTLLSFPNLSSFPTYVNTLEVGKSIYAQKTYTSLGVDPTTGLYKFQDINGDNVISFPADVAATKQIAQKFYGGFSNGFQYRAFNLDIFFQFVKQTGYSDAVNFDPPGLMTNQPADVMQRWQKPGDNQPVQRFSTSFGNEFTAYLNYQSSDANIVDASFVRLKNISLSWRLPTTFITKAHMTSGKIFISGQNVLTWTNYRGLDPENQRTVLPPLRMLTAGLQLTF